MKKILLLSYAISPNKGSEYAVGWNYVVNMSKDNELVVLYGAAGNHLGDTEELEEYIVENPLKNVQLIPIKPDKKTERLNSLNKKGKFVYSFYFAYHRWHRLVYEYAKELVKQEHFDVVHFLTPIGYREPGYLWKLGLPYIWGPIGGTNNVPASLMKALPGVGKVKLGIRKIINSLQFRYSINLHKAIEKTDVLIAATTYDQHNFQRVYHKKVYYLPENGITHTLQPNTAQKEKSEVINVMWIGRIDAGKALIILLSSFVKVKNKNKIRLHIVGDGPLKSSSQDFAEQNGINPYITWYGKVKREKVFEILSTSQLHVITSLAEANTTVIWEAMAAGVPTLSLDHCGMHDIICEKCGIKIPIQTYEQVINDIAAAINDLAIHPEKLQALSAGVMECATKYTWDKRVSFFTEMYDLAIKNHQEKYG